MCIFFKLSTPFTVQFSHLRILGNLVCNHIFHYLIDRVIVLVLWIGHIPEITIKQRSRKPEAFVRRGGIT